MSLSTGRALDVRRQRNLPHRSQRRRASLSDGAVKSATSRSPSSVRPSSRIKSLAAACRLRPAAPRARRSPKRSGLDDRAERAPHLAHPLHAVGNGEPSPLLDLADEEDLHLAAAVGLGAEEPGRDDAGVVHHQEGAPAGKDVRQLGDRPVLESVRLADRPVGMHHEQTRRLPVRCRFLGNALRPGAGNRRPLPSCEPLLTALRRKPRGAEPLAAVANCRSVVAASDAGRRRPLGLDQRSGGQRFPARRELGAEERGQLAHLVRLGGRSRRRRNRPGRAAAPTGGRRWSARPGWSGATSRMRRERSSPFEVGIMRSTMARSKGWSGEGGEGQLPGPSGLDLEALRAAARSRAREPDCLRHRRRARAPWRVFPFAQMASNGDAAETIPNKPLTPRTHVS